MEREMGRDPMGRAASHDATEEPGLADPALVLSMARLRAGALGPRLTAAVAGTQGRLIVAVAGLAFHGLVAPGWRRAAPRAAIGAARHEERHDGGAEPGEHRRGHEGMHLGREEHARLARLAPERGVL